jgi:hypothetical protein
LTQRLSAAAISASLKILSEINVCAISELAVQSLIASFGLHLKAITTLL